MMKVKKNSKFTNAFSLFIYISTTEAYKLTTAITSIFPTSPTVRIIPNATGTRKRVNLYKVITRKVDYSYTV